MFYYVLNSAHSFAWIYALVCADLRTRLRRFTQSSVVSVAFANQKTGVAKLGNVSPRGRFGYVQQFGKMRVAGKAFFPLRFEVQNLGKQYPFVWVQLAKIPNIYGNENAFTHIAKLCA